MSAEDLRRLLMVAALVELYFFYLQRTALDWVRYEQLPSEARDLLLPDWYKLVSVAKIAKWVVAAAAGHVGGWGLAIAILVGFWLPKVFLPISYLNYLPILRRQASMLPPDTASEIVASLDEFARAVARPRGLPILSLVGLLYPLVATATMAHTSAAPTLYLAGVFLSNLGYLLVASAYLGGSFRVLGLTSRRSTLIGAGAAFVLGVVATNAGFSAIGA